MAMESKPENKSPVMEALREFSVVGTEAIRVSRAFNHMEDGGYDVPDSPYFDRVSVNSQLGKRSSDLKVKMYLRQEPSEKITASTLVLRQAIQERMKEIPEIKREMDRILETIFPNYQGHHTRLEITTKVLDSFIEKNLREGLTWATAFAPIGVLKKVADLMHLDKKSLQALIPDETME